MSRLRPFPVQVCQAYDPKRFNFTKVPQKEILFQLDETAQAAGFEHQAAFGSNPNLVLINVSPIEYGHVLMVPRVLDNLPQVSSSMRTLSSDTVFLFPLASYFSY